VLLFEFGVNRLRGYRKRTDIDILLRVRNLHILIIQALLESLGQISQQGPVIPGANPGVGHHYDFGTAQRIDKHIGFGLVENALVTSLPCSRLGTLRRHPRIFRGSLTCANSFRAALSRASLGFSTLLLQPQLHADMARFKAELGIEKQGSITALISGELNQHTLFASGAFNSVLDELFADAF